MKAVILARVSSKDQEEGHSLDAQIRNLRLYADRKNLEIVKEYTLIESSTKGDRPEFMRMINFIKDQKAKMALIVDTVDRLQRGFKEKPLLDELLDKDILELHFVKEGNILPGEKSIRAASAYVLVKLLAIWPLIDELFTTSCAKIA